MSYSRIRLLEEGREYFSSKKYFVRSNRIVLIILLKLIAIDHFVSKSDRTSSLNLRTFLIDLKMHNILAKKLEGHLNLLVIFILKNLLIDWNF